MERAEKQGLGLVLVHTKKGKPREREGGGGGSAAYILHLSGIRPQDIFFIITLNSTESNSLKWCTH
jgi:hypothetical protein